MQVRDNPWLGESIKLTGPESIGFAHVARVLSGVLAKDVSYVPVPHEAAGQAMRRKGMPEWIIEGYAELNEGFADGYADTITDGVERLTGHPPRSYQQFAHDFRQAWT